MLEVIMVVFISQVVLNEVMANPMGRETGTGAPGKRNEFVEIYNNLSEPINLLGWKLGDDEDLDPLAPFPDSAILELYPGISLELELPPGGYALVLDRDYLERGDGNYPQPYEIPSGTVVLSVQDADIGNGLANDDPVFLIDEVGDTVDIYPSGFNPSDGVSMERRLPEFDEWLPSSQGCTPGRRNSVSVRYDIAVVPNDFSVEPQFPQAGESVVFNIKVANMGIYDADEISVCGNFGYDTSCSQSFQLAASETASVPIEIGSFDEGTVQGKFFLMSNNDESPNNDTVLVEFPVGVSMLILNEIEYSGQIEWVELYNRSNGRIEIDGISVRDRSGKTSEGCPEFTLEAGEFVVLTGDSVFCNTNPSISCIYLKGFPTLNNSSEDLILLNRFGISIDSVSYSSSWGGRNGRSLERLSDQLPGWERYNWSESTAPNGSTPGMRNSVAIGHGEVKPNELFSFESRVIDRGTAGGMVVLNYELPKVPSSVEIVIFDEIGRQMAPKFSKEVYSQRGQIFLDVHELPRGLYILLFTAKTYDGDTYSKTKSFSVR